MKRNEVLEFGELLEGVSQWLIGIDCHPVRHARQADPQGNGLALEKFDDLVQASDCTQIQQNFECSGDYVRYWLPELAQLPLKYLHCPWEVRSLETDTLLSVMSSEGAQRGAEECKRQVAWRC